MQSPLRYFGGAILALFLTQTIPAATITYSTIAVGLAGSPAVIFTDGITSILYSQLLNASADPSSGPTFTSLGNFTVTTTSTTVDIIPATTFILRVFENAPVVGATGDFIVTVSGGVSKTSSSATAAFLTSPASNPAKVAVGSYFFQLNNTNPVALVPPSANGGVTSLEAVATQAASTAPLAAAAVPEPGSLMLLGGAVLLLALMFRKKTSR